MCRQEWQDSEYSHSSAAFVSSTSVPRLMPEAAALAAEGVQRVVGQDDVEDRPR
jgi:hypothetical protein